MFVIKIGDNSWWNLVEPNAKKKKKGGIFIISIQFLYNVL